MSDEVRQERFYHRPPGKKIGVLRIDVGAGRDHAEFELRLDQFKGDFIVAHDDTAYFAKTREALKNAMREVALKYIDLTWTRYIEISYRSTSADHGREYDVDEKRNCPIRGIDLNWTVREFSSGFITPGQKKPMRRYRDVDEGGKPGREQPYGDELPDCLVPYTPERLIFLRSVRDALTALDSRMVALFRGSPEQLAKRIDSAPFSLLAMPAPEASSKKRGG